jgi:ethanolamine utilization protein EutQ (cupin superfamily)
MAVELVPGEPLTGASTDMPVVRTLFPPDLRDTTSMAVMEWELTCAEWSDRHPHDEFNYVLAGELHVECEGQTVVARTGDLVRVLGGSLGRYAAPKYARMLAVYAPNPTAAESDSFSFRPLAAEVDDSI